MKLNRLKKLQIDILKYQNWYNKNLISFEEIPNYIKSQISL